MTKSYRVKIGLLLLFGLLYSLSYWPSSPVAAAWENTTLTSAAAWENPALTPAPSAVTAASAKTRQTPKSAAAPSPTQTPPAASQEPTVATAESIAAKYGSLDRIPIHSSHSTVMITTPEGVQKKLECLDCHYTAEGATGRDSVRYLGTVQCSTCHIEDNDERQKYPHPPLPTGRETLAEYSHAAHVDPIGRIGPNGQRQDCTHCHNPSGNKATMPTHAECFACHSGPKAAKPIFNEQSDQCRICHSEDKIDRNLLNPKEGRAERPLVMSAHASYRDLNLINHSAHLKERNGVSIQCLQCHSGMLRKSSINQFAQLPTMNDCATCHSSVKRATVATQMENCQLCHREVTTSLMPFSTTFTDNPGVIKPVSPERQMPIDHTAAFRINHQEQARQPDNRCSSCHSGIDKFVGNNCTSCHNNMRPRSHTPPRFRDIDHGRFAAMSRSSCATCHSTEFCARCHNQLPRDHQPLGIFAGGIHKFQARANLRACLTCHTYENTCQPCHNALVTDPIIRPPSSASPSQPASPLPVWPPGIKNRRSP